MNILKWTTSLGVLCLSVLLYPQYSHAETFKSSEFLKWKPKSRSFYIEASVGMASLVAAQNDKKHEKCIDDWYYQNETSGDKFILDIMRKYPEYHPRGIILGVLKKKCGSFNYTEK